MPRVTHRLIWCYPVGMYGRRRRRRRLRVDRRDVAARWAHRCAYCGTPLDTTEKIILDHYLPRALGGPDTRDNLVSACQDCDRNKRDRLPWPLAWLLLHWAGDDTPDQ